MAATEEGKAPPASLNPKVRHFNFSVKPIPSKDSITGDEEDNDPLASAFASLEQRSAPTDYASQLQRRMNEEAPLVSPTPTAWQEPDFGPTQVEEEPQQPPSTPPVAHTPTKTPGAPKKKKKKAKRKKEEEEEEEQKKKKKKEKKKSPETKNDSVATTKAATVTVSEEPVKKRTKQKPPTRDEKHRGENVRMGAISEQRTDTPHAAHKTKAQDRVKEIEREEYFAAEVESFVLGAAVRGKPTPEEAQAHYNDILERASSLPLRTGSDKMCIVFCDQLLVSTFDQLGSSSKAATVTSVTPTGRDIMKAPKNITEAMTASQNTTVMRTTTSDLYMVQKRMCAPNGVVTAPSGGHASLVLTPLEQLELDRIRALQKAQVSAGEEGGNSLRQQLEKTRSPAQLSVIEGKYRAPLLKSVTGLFERFEETMLSDASSSKAGLSFVMNAEELETCFNLECTARAEASLCAYRLENERQKAAKAAKKKKAAEEGGEEEDDDAAPEPKKKRSASTTRAAQRGRTADPIFRKLGG